jgi:hypothetical protein
MLTGFGHQGVLGVADKVVDRAPGTATYELRPSRGAMWRYLATSEQRIPNHDDSI